MAMEIFFGKQSSSASQAIEKSEVADLLSKWWLFCSNITFESGTVVYICKYGGIDIHEGNREGRDSVEEKMGGK